MSNDTKTKIHECPNCKRTFPAIEKSSDPITAYELDVSSGSCPYCRTHLKKYRLKPTNADPSAAGRINPEVEERMAPGWSSGLPETPCGKGSLPLYARSVGVAIPPLIRSLNIKTVNNVGAGDLAWMDAFNVEYHSGPGVWFRNYDIIRWVPSVTLLDITEERPPNCDLAICRDVMIHLTDREVSCAIRNLFKSSRWVLATTYDVERNDDLDLAKRPHREINLQEPPWSIGETKGKIADHVPGKYLGLWEGGLK